MKGAGYQGRTVTVKVKFSPFKTYVRAKTLDQSTDSLEEIGGLPSNVSRNLNSGERFASSGSGLAIRRRSLTRIPTGDPNPDLEIVVASETKQSRLPRGDCHACVPKRLNGGTVYNGHFGVQARTLQVLARTCQQ